MLQALLIAPDMALRQDLETLLAVSPLIRLLHTTKRYPTPEELPGMLSFYAPQAVFVDIYSAPQAMALCSELANRFPGVFLVALHRSSDPQLLLQLMNTGIREFLCHPYQRALLDQTLNRLTRVASERPKPPDLGAKLYSFLPAKPGCGCSTVAVNSALALARLPDTKALLADADLNCGLVQFLLKLNAPFSFHDAVSEAQKLDARMWAEIVCHSGPLDVLTAGLFKPAWSMEPGYMLRAVEFLRRCYSVMCFDHCGLLEPHSLELLAQSNRILVVMNPDLSSAYLAREKLRVLRNMDLEDRVTIILNRWRREGRLSIADVESVLGLPVQQTLPEDEAGVHKAILAGGAVEPASDLGREFIKLAHSLTDNGANRDPASRQRMVEYFSLVPARHSLFPSHKP